MILLAALCIISIGLLVPSRRLASPQVVTKGRRRRSRKTQRVHDIDLGVLALEVATRLRAGMSVERAWSVTLQRAGFPAITPVLDDEGRPKQLVSLGQGSVLKSITDRLAGRPRLSSLTRVALPSLLTATRLTYRTGAPLADVLDECAEGLTEAGEAQSARQIALSGPKSTAMLLAWLPVIGVFLGIAMGANTLDFLISSGLGRLCLVIGVGLEIAGLAWVQHLVRKAEVDGAIGGVT